jgi:excisionase family DNA binding protein
MTQTPTGSTDGTPEVWMQVPDVARELGIPRSRCYELIAQGDLPAVRIGARTIRVPRSELRRFLLNERPASQTDVTERE